MAVSTSWEWNSIAYDVYKDIVGEEEFKVRLEKGNQTPPLPGLFSGHQLARQTKKLKLLFGIGAIKDGTRPTHPNGVGAYGTATIVSKPQFPECDFFIPGESFPVRLRHSSLEKGHDAGADFRSASLKFADVDQDGPLDIIMMTGPGTVLWNVQTVYDLMAALRGRDYKEYLLKNPEYFRIYVDGVRRAPNSFHDLRYYSKMIFDFKAKDGVQRYARLRMFPADGRPETGFLKKQECRKPWENEQHPSETRPVDYLSQEYKELLSKGPVKYRLQIQLHEVKPDDPPQILYVGRGWDETTHPWLDLADVIITSLLPSDVTEKTCYALDNLPTCMSLLPAQTVYDYNCIAQIRAEIYRWTQKIRLLRSLPSNTDHISQYLIRVETGVQSGAGTDAKISITLFGTKGRTDTLALDKWFHNDFERGQTAEYTVNGMDVGEVLLLQLHNDGSGEWSKTSDWFVENISVISAEAHESYEFPCHRWVLSDVKVFQGRALLPQQEQHELTRIERRAEVLERQKQYKWGQLECFGGLPGFIDAATHSDLPRDSQVSKKLSLARSSGHLSKFFSLFESRDNFDDFKKMFPGSFGKIPKFAEGDLWMQDHVFGMQFLNGCNPCVIRRCEKLPPNFPVTDNHVSGQLDRGLTLGQEMKAGHVYMVDYKELEGVQRKDEKGARCYTADPLALFYVTSSGNLVPIAIQLFQQPSDTNPIWNPCDSHYDWLLAKMWLRNADYQVHQIHSQLLNIQLLMEVFAVATWRKLSSVHPVFKLLLPHIHSVMAINTIGRNDLNTKGVMYGISLSLSRDGQLQLLRKNYKTFQFSMFFIPDVLGERGIDDPSKLPNFYYRDDSLHLWEAIAKFVNEVLSIYYQSDDDIKGDDELQTWVEDIHQNGYPSRPGDVDHEFPKSLQTRDQLVRLVTCVVFNCSCQQAAVKGSLFEVTAFIPNTPPLMRRPPPTQKGTATLKFIMDTLPNKSQTRKHITAMYDMSRFSKDEFLGNYSHGHFVDDETEECIVRFQDKLQEISQAIKVRNQALHWPYVCLLPECVPNAIIV